MGDVTYEDDNLVDTIDEPWREVRLYGTHHKLPRVRPHTPFVATQRFQL